MLHQSRTTARDQSATGRHKQAEARVALTGRQVTLQSRGTARDCSATGWHKRAEARVALTGRPVTLQSRTTARDWSATGQHKQAEARVALTGRKSHSSRAQPPATGARLGGTSTRVARTGRPVTLQPRDTARDRSATGRKKHD